jgi:4-diphosphocytidyl-2-C-methyl-D-erythritol kinase
MHVRRFATHVEVLAPAKINLFLEVLGKRADGFHELETLLAAISTFDCLRFSPDFDTGELRLECRWAIGCSPIAQATAKAEKRSSAARELLYEPLPTATENLAWRAANLLRERASVPHGATIRLIKRIPAAAGLGGASSDAAAALVAANVGWDLKWPHERLMNLAAELGSDVPFFLSAGGCVCRGRGEQVVRAHVGRLHVVVVRPAVGLSTARVFANWQPVAPARRVDTLLRSLRTGNTTASGREMVNSLEAAAAKLTPWIATLKERFSEQGTLGQQMSGSGSSYFGLCRSARHARRVAARLRARRSGAVLCATTEIASTTGVGR